MEEGEREDRIDEGQVREGERKREKGGGEREKDGGGGTDRGRKYKDTTCRS